MNETIFITGGTGKVGTQLVKHFFEKQFNVIFTSLEQSEIDTLINQLNQKSSKKNQILGLVINLMEKDFTTKILKIFKKTKLQPNHLINCARSLNFLKIGEDGVTQRQEWVGELTLDIIVPYELSMAVANQSDSKLSNIINISSMYGIVPFNPNLYKNPKQESPIQYSVSKAAQIHLTKELAIRLSGQNIKVNTISFGGIEGRVDEEFKKKYSQLCPLKKMLKEEEVIGAVDFLVSDQSNYITGHNLVVDGGWTIW